MKTKLYETRFAVTETLQDGKERTIEKSVFSPMFRNGVHITESERVLKSIEILKEEHYYKIKYIGTRTKTILEIV